MGMVGRLGRRIGQLVEVLGRALDVFAGVGVRSRGVAARGQRQRQDELERITRLHATGQMSDREFNAKKKRLR